MEGIRWLPTLGFLGSPRYKSRGNLKEIFFCWGVGSGGVVTFLWLAYWCFFCYLGSLGLGEGLQDDVSSAVFLGVLGPSPYTVLKP